MLISGKSSRRTENALWATLAFGFAVFGGAVGCILMLLCRSVAAPVLAFSLVATVVTVIQTTSALGMTPSTLLALLVWAALFWYATIAARKDWLR
ncbi:hypothetical protein [uncultured Roseobacter sp.]|uniref:hypothetical protein n=1 Tax=uncultured Roseobacter sp. TaxID=114847 RepID=UPI002623B8DF|nr:hypothetical protein [uncultured Roseobacter sp.]